MILSGRKFRPAWWSIVLTAVAVLTFVLLGNWQIERAAYKDAVRDKFEQRLLLDYERFDGSADIGDIEYRKLLLRGRFDDAHNFLLDNQLHRGRAGYQVLTPFLLADSESIVLVNRGWAAWGGARNPLPRIPAAVARDEIAGIASFPSEPVMKLGGFELGGEWPQLIPYIDISILREQYAQGLLPMVLWLAPEQPGAYVRDWNPVWMPAEKSRAYATQWYAFAAVALVLFVVLNLRKIK